MNPKQNDADETEPPYPREHPGHHRGYSWRENNGDRYATAGATLRPEVRAYFGSDGSTAASPARPSPASGNINTPPTIRFPDAPGSHTGVRET